MNCNCDKVAQIRYKAPYILAKGHNTGSGYDMRTVWDMEIYPGHTLKVETGVYLELPKGFEAQVRPKSGLSSQGLLVHFGTVDEDYRGQVLVTVTNLTGKTIYLDEEQKVAQLVFVRKDMTILKSVKEIDTDTTRGTGGFGSTGRF